MRVPADLLYSNLPQLTEMLYLLALAFAGVLIVGIVAFSLLRSRQLSARLTGDACHTRWGWENGVEPGRFSSDRPRSARSLAALRTLARDHPRLEVRVGHQP